MANKNRALARERRHLRVRKQVFGNPERPRLNVFKSLTGIYAQIIDDTADVRGQEARNLAPAVTSVARTGCASLAVSRAAGSTSTACIDAGDQALATSPP